MRVLFAGGGTGGHVYMGIALASLLRQSDPSAGVSFAGSEKGIENRIVPELGYPLETIKLGGLKNVGIARRLSTMAQLVPAMFKSIGIVRRFSPSLIVSVGGYSAGPLALAGRLRGVPLVLIEPNAYPGFTNRILSRIAQGAALAWEDCREFFKGEVEITGIPVRPDFHRIPEYSGRKGRPFRLLVFGGSQGSRPINNLVVEALPYLSNHELEIVHQTGPYDFEKVREGYRESKMQNANILEYIDDMPEKFSWCDLILCRAGASTVAEITAAGRASILVPFPQAADNHQRKNAEALGRRNASMCLLQESLSGKKLAEHINGLARDRDRIAAMAARARELSRPDSSEKIIALMQRVEGSPGQDSGSGNQDH